jgi:hypothetical protein
MHGGYIHNDDEDDIKNRIGGNVKINHHPIF